MNTHRNLFFVLSSAWLSGCLLTVERKDVIDGSMCDDGASKQVFYADVDGDGYGDPESTTLACGLPDEGFSANASDCDDLNNRVHPDADEACDGFDNDCNGQTDEAGGSAWYEDADGDGFGDESTEQILCEPGDGWVVEDADGGFDCDDGDATVFPGGDELCSDSKDNDCDGDIDEDDATDAQTWYPDEDDDGYGDMTDSGRVACEADRNEVTDNTDCDDDNDETYPGAPEYCDFLDWDEAGEEVWISIDSDCDGETNDIESEDAQEHWPDADGDGMGDWYTTPEVRCWESGWSIGGFDCDDTTPAGPDEDGGGSYYGTDLDGDGWSGVWCEAVFACYYCDDPGAGWSDSLGDCEDDDPSIHPGAEEICDDGIDNNCDGYTDMEWDECYFPDDGTGDGGA